MVNTKHTIGNSNSSSWVKNIVLVEVSGEECI